MKLKEQRRLKNLTQQEVADFLKLKKQTYQNYELEKRQIDIETLKKLADFYGVTLDYLCDHETKNQFDLPPITEDQKQLINMVLKLNQLNFVRAYSYVSGLYVSQESN